MKLPPVITRAPRTGAASTRPNGRDLYRLAGPTAAFVVTVVAAALLLANLHHIPPGGAVPAPQTWRATATDFALPAWFSALPLNCLAGVGLGVASTPAVAYVDGVRTGAQGAQDLVTFQFAGGRPGETSISAQVGATFTLRAGGKPATLDGAYGALVSIKTADGHTHYSGPSDIKTGDHLVIELRKVRDDSGVVQWAIGLSQVPFFRTAYLGNPTRLVIAFQVGSAGK